MRCVFLALALLGSSASAEGPTDDLKRCLQDLGGIAWRLPYAPRMSVASCASPAANYKVVGRPAAGTRQIVLGSPIEVTPDEFGMSEDERRAAVQSAALAHFDALFRRHGYTRVSGPGAQELAPYFSYRYTRADGIALVWRVQSDNRWLVTVEGQR